MNTKPGDVLTPGIAFTGDTEMGAYLYIDYNQDAVFTTPLDETGMPVVGSELVSFSSYRGKNSNGTQLDLENAKAVDADLSGPEEEREADDRMESAAIVAEDKGAYPADREGRTR